jgi:hypothetical protein
MINGHNRELTATIERMLDADTRVLLDARPDLALGDSFPVLGLLSEKVMHTRAISGIFGGGAG